MSYFTDERLSPMRPIIHLDERHNITHMELNGQTINPIISFDREDGTQWMRCSLELFQKISTPKGAA